MGDFGTYQIVFFFLICLPASLPSAFSAFNQPFVVGQPPHHCRVPPGREDLLPHTQDDAIDNCLQFNQTQVDLLGRQFARSNVSLIPCQDGWVYDNSTYTDTLVTEVSFPSSFSLSSTWSVTARTG